MRWPLIVLLVMGVAVRVTRADSNDDSQARAQLVGSHALSLQWLGWDRPGRATVTVDSAGALHLKGQQRVAVENENEEDYLTVDGTVTNVTAKTFELVGTIVSRVHHIAGGKACERTGKMKFAISGKRRYWRLQSMQNPCDPVTDYVDLYFK